MMMPAAPLPFAVLPLIVLWYTPARVGCGCPAFAPLVATAFGLWLASVIPQSLRLSVTVLFEMVLSWLGPISSVIRIPPTLLVTVLLVTVEFTTLSSWIASP